MPTRQRGYRPAKRLAAVGAAVLIALLPAMAEAVVGPGLEATGWREVPNPNKAENTFSAGPDGAIEVVSRDSVSTLFKPVDVDLKLVLFGREL